MPTIVREATTAAAPTGARTEITLITPGWGSSGYYSPAVLEQAAKDKVFPKGTQMHIDHDLSGGVGSVSTLAAVLTEDARWEPNWVDEDGTKGRLVAPNRVFSHKREMLAEMADVIGTSIAAGAEVSWGEAEGQPGKIVEALVPGKTNRVDYVTVAGRGGRISEVLEAYRVQEARNVGMWLEARLHSMFTSVTDEMFGDGRLTREERITLSSGLGDALTSLTAKVEAEAPQLYERDLWEDPTSTAAAEAAAPTDSLPDPARATEGKEPPVATIQIEEAAHRDLVEQSGRATALEAEKTAAETRATVAEGALKQANDTAAAAVVTAALEAVGITAPKLAARLAEGYPVQESGALDEEALRASVAESVAELQVAGGAGTPRGVGDTTATESTQPAEVTLASAREAILAAKGYTPKGA